MGKSDRLLVPVTMAMCFLLGFESGGYQLAIARVAEEFSLNNTFMGLLVSTQFTAMVLTPLISGMIADRIGKKAVMLVAAALLAAGCALVVLVPAAWVFTVGIALVGAGFGICEMGTCSTLADARPAQADRYMSVSQCLFSLGAVVSPLAGRFAMIRLGFDWRFVFIVCGVASALALALLAITHFPRRAQGESSRQTAVAGKILGPCTLLLLAAMFCYACSESGAGYFFDTFFIAVFDAGDASAGALSAFWLTMMVSRGLCGVFAIGEKCIRHALAAMCVLLALMWWVPDWRLAVFLCAALGFVCGPVWPLLMAAAATRNPKRSGLITGLMMTGSALGSAVAPALMGLAADLAGVRVSFAAIAGVAALAFAIETLRRRRFP